MVCNSLTHNYLINNDTPSNAKNSTDFSSGHKTQSVTVELYI